MFSRPGYHTPPPPATFRPFTPSISYWYIPGTPQAAELNHPTPSALRPTSDTTGEMQTSCVLPSIGQVHTSATHRWGLCSTFHQKNHVVFHNYEYLVVVSVVCTRTNLYSCTSTSSSEKKENKGLRRWHTKNFRARSTPA